MWGHRPVSGALSIENRYRVANRSASPRYTDSSDPPHAKRGSSLGAKTKSEGLPARRGSSSTSFCVNLRSASGAQISPIPNDGRHDRRGRRRHGAEGTTPSGPAGGDRSGGSTPCQAATPAVPPRNERWTPCPAGSAAGGIWEPRTQMVAGERRPCRRRTTATTGPRRRPNAPARQATYQPTDQDTLPYFLEDRPHGSATATQVLSLRG